MSPFQRALSVANIPADSFEPLMQVGKRTDNDRSWVVCVVAANEWAFELPGTLPEQNVIEAAQWIIRWDMAMAGDEDMDRGLIAKAMWCATVMKPCPLQEVISSAHPMPKL